MEKIEKLIRLLYLEGYDDGKKQKKTPHKYTADSDKGKELYDFIEQELDKAREEGFNEGVKEAEESEQIQADWDMEELENIVNRIVEKLDKFNNK